MADDAGKIASAALYQRDFVAWAEAQAAALAAGRLGELDLANLAEEVGDLGSEQINACRSFVTRVMEHLLKIEFVRAPNDVRHWRGEIAQFRGELEGRLTRTIENRVRAELVILHARAIRSLRAAEYLDHRQAERIVSRPFTWEQITDPEFYTEPTDP